MTTTRKTVKMISTAEAAALTNMTPAGFRSAMHRARSQGINLQLPPSEWPDLRSPRWDEAGVKKWYANRPGRGWHRSAPTPARRGVVKAGHP